MGDREHPAHDADSGLDRPRVLVVDDDADTRTLWTLILERRGFAVHTVADARAGLVIARAWQPGVILLDLVMPGFSGWDLLRDLRAGGETKAIPVIAVTGLARAEAIRGGCDGYVGKPCEPDDVVAELRRVLARRRREGA